MGGRVGGCRACVALPAGSARPLLPSGGAGRVLFQSSWGWCSGGRSLGPSQNRSWQVSELALAHQAISKHHASSALPPSLHAQNNHPTHTLPTLHTPHPHPPAAPGPALPVLCRLWQRGSRARGGAHAHPRRGPRLRASRALPAPGRGRGGRRRHGAPRTHLRKRHRRAAGQLHRAGLVREGREARCARGRGGAAPAAGAAAAAAAPAARCALLCRRLVSGCCRGAQLGGSCRLPSSPHPRLPSPPLPSTPPLSLSPPPQGTPPASTGWGTCTSAGGAA